ncbi:MAG TPA: glycoside hydrolase domain-containing protein [Chitinophagaceae bacterium]|nr:glycoside hydrolase domain-containing protein [Chitinophagaceae bacterium]
MRKVVFVWLCLLIFPLTYAQVYPGQLAASKVPAPAAHYQQEYTFDTTLNPAAWNKQRKGLNVSFATTDERYFRTEVPALEEPSLHWEGTGWKGERLNMQILVWSPDTLEQVRVLIKDLKNASGKSIPKNNFQVNMVRYVVANYPYGAKDATCGESPYKNLYLMPDRFEAFDRFDLPGRTLRPVWVSLDIPGTAEAGTYNGTIEVRSEKQFSTLNISIHVQQQLLPEPALWKHRLDLWQNPWVVAWENNITPWSDDHKSLLKKHLKLYADAGGTFITTYAVHSPWADNSYMIEGGMIEWIKQGNGKWKFDYKIFDEYVELCMSVGINEAITIYSPVPWGSRFRYMDEQTGNYVYESWPPESKAFEEHWNIFLTDLKKHLEQKGWFNKTYLGINENEMSQTLAAINMVKKHSPKWKITYAGDWHANLDPLLDDYCFLYGKEPDVNAVKQRTAKGKTTTWYVCCNPAVPNNFVFSPPVEGRWQGWYSAAHGYSGFLRWAYDAWPADAMRDARHVFWPSGDSYLVYPGGNSCIRFEKMREGIVDYEKISILKEKAAASTDKNVKALLAQLQQHLQTFLTEKDFETKKITADVAKGKRIIEQLSNALGK